MLLAFLLWGTSIAFAQDQTIERRIDSLLSLMTLEEKCGQLTQISAGRSADKDRYLTDEQNEEVRKGLVGSVLNLTGAVAVTNVQKVAVMESRLHIPLIFGLDVIHGFRTILPVPLAEASTWSPELVEQSARLAATEASAAGIQWTFGPMVDIARDPRWGRIVEGSGEDPYLGSVMAAARVRGFQGNDVKDPASILACAKHFAAYGAADAGREYNTVDLSERTLREIYLPPFQSAVEAGVGSVMSSFNEIAGGPSSANPFLLAEVLRHDWKFNGFVVSDWTAIEELQKHGVAGSRADAGRLAITAGVDMDMVSGIYQQELPVLVKGSKVREDVVNEAVRNVLRAKCKLGLFEEPDHGASPEREGRVILSKEHLQTALEIARRSIVLLKNDTSLLPISRDIKTLAVIGPLADDREDPLGPWHANGRSEDVVTVLEGIKRHVSPQTTVLYARGCGIRDGGQKDRSEALAMAKRADVVVMVLGESEDMSGEAASRSNLDIPGVQEEVLKQIIGTHTPIVLVLMNGRPLTIPWEAAHVPAILETWFLGVQAGNAIADVLFGDANPSGKLPVTFPRSVGQIPLYYSHKNTGRPMASEEEKYTSRYIDAPNSPLFPFGYGLSYTTFSYSNLAVDKPTIGMNDSVEVSVQVTNSGNVGGEEVVQCYVQDIVASVTRPVKELKAFRRIMLTSGETKRVSFSIHTPQLALYNVKMERVVEPGVFKVFVGGNSVDVLEGQFNVREQ